MQLVHRVNQKNRFNGDSDPIPIVHLSESFKKNDSFVNCTSLVDECQCKKWREKEKVGQKRLDKQQRSLEADAAKCTKITDMFRRPAGSRESEGGQDARVNQPTQPREPTEEDDAVAWSSTADPIESHTITESEAQEGPKIEAVYTQEESFEQEWCASLMQVTELAFVKDEEVPQQECVPIKEEFIEQECVPIAEELPHENHVCTLEENNKLGSNLCDDSPSECELGFRGNPTKQAALSCLFILQNLILNTSSVLEIHILTQKDCFNITAALQLLHTGASQTMVTTATPHRVTTGSDELDSTIEHAVKAALHTVLCAITKAVGSKFTEFQVEMAGKEKENESLKLRLEISEGELKAVRGCINAADANIKQPLIFQDPKESHAIPESEAQEGPKIEAVYTQEESFEQECCASLMQVTELAFVKDEEVPQQECVPIKEEFIEQECVPIAEELPHESHVCTLWENNKLGSNLCDDSPSECDLGFRASKVDEGEHDSTPSPQCKNSSRGKPQCKKHRETTPQEEYRGNSFQVKYGNLEEEGITQYHSVEKERVLDEGLVVKECICLGEGIKQSRVEGPEQLKSGKAASAPYARSLLEDSEELGDDDYQASKRELEAEDSGDSDAELDSDGLKGERELVDSEVVLTQSMVVKKDALSKRYYRKCSSRTVLQTGRRCTERYKLCN
ncbi:UNVERIFIED_CONTAM: hypothetical protein FKN15_072594 [Acipenser sinensis]